MREHKLSIHCNDMAVVKKIVDPTIIMCMCRFVCNVYVCYVYTLKLCIVCMLYTEAVVTER